MNFTVTAYFNNGLFREFEKSKYPQTIVIPDYELSSEDKNGHITYMTPPEYTMLAAERTFTFLNHDARPNAKAERSVSVGDLLAVQEHGDPYRVYVFAVANIGMMPVWI